MDIQKTYRTYPMTALFYEILQGNIRGVAKLLRATKNIHNSEVRPLHWATMPMIASPSMLDFLIETGVVNINAQDSNGLTALHLAMLRNHIFIVPILLKAGADIGRCDHQGRTPFAAGLIAFETSANHMEREKSFNNLCHLIQAGIIHNTDQYLLDNILLNSSLDKHESYKLKLLEYKARLQFNARLVMYNIPNIFDKESIKDNNLERISLNEELCFLRIYNRVRAWRPTIVQLLQDIQQAITETGIKEHEPLGRILQLEMQYTLLVHLKNNLKYYHPNTQFSSDIPTAFSNLNGVSSKHLKALVESRLYALKSAYGRQVVPSDHLSTDKRIQLATSMISYNIKENADTKPIIHPVLKDFRTRLLYFEHQRAHSISFTHQDFIQKYCKIIAQYVDKYSDTLPDHVKKAFRSYFIERALSALELDDFGKILQINIESLHLQKDFTHIHINPRSAPFTLIGPPRLS